MLEFDSGYIDEKGFLHITKDGRDIDGFTPFFIGYSPSGENVSDNFSVKLESKTEKFINITEDEEVKLCFSYSSEDKNGISDADGMAHFRIDSVKIKSFVVKQGENTLDITDYLTPGIHTVRITAENSEGVTGSISYIVNCN